VHWDFAAILIVLGVVVPWHGRARMKNLMALHAVTSADRLALYASTIAMQWGIVVVVAWRAWARGISAAALGLPILYPGRTAVTAIVLTAGLVAVQLIGLRHAAQLPEEKRGHLQHLAERLLPQRGTERLAFVAVAATAGVCEEFLYRGFVFAALAVGWQDFGTLSVFGSAALFAMAHLYQGRRGMATTFGAGLLFAAARVVTGSLVAGVVAHAAVDLVAGLLGARLLGRPRRGSNA
jgi:membrane protease YdiL (CAAX protease family)